MISLNLHPLEITITGSSISIIGMFMFLMITGGFLTLLIRSFYIRRKIKKQGQYLLKLFNCPSMVIEKSIYDEIIKVYDIYSKLELNLENE